MRMALALNNLKRVDMPLKQRNQTKPKSVMAEVLGCNLEVCEFKVQSHCYFYLQTNTTEKGMTLLIPPSYGLNSITAVHLQEWPWL